MSESIEGLRRQIGSAEELQSVVRTMKALAASNIGQYERSVAALGDYARTVELGLGECFRQGELRAAPVDAAQRAGELEIGAVVFGSDQGLVGRFNEIVADHAITALAALPGRCRVWAVGERVHARLLDAGLAPGGLYTVPSSVRAVIPLVARILVDSPSRGGQGQGGELHLFYNRPLRSGSFEPVGQRLLPLDERWRRDLAGRRWPTQLLPEVMGAGSTTLSTLIGEYLFVSLFRACVESLASENASRLAAMERADRNIDGLLEHMHGSYHRLRQSGIDEELFDVVSGFEALTPARR